MIPDLDLLGFVIAGLATWRASSLLVWEDGPFEMFERIRHLVGLRDPSEPVTGLLPGIWSCVWCMSVWQAPLWLALALSPLWPLAAIMALSAAAIMVERLVR